MSIWGKILGATAGLALGGPLGAIIGGAAGHAADMAIEGFSGPHSDASGGDATKQIAFTTAVIVLGAKMAKADGVVTRDEVQAFKQVFQVPANEQKGVARLFDIAKRDSRGFETYAKQLARMFADKPAVLEQLLDALFHIAKADNQYHPKEREFLSAISEIFGFDRTTFRRIEARHTVLPHDDPYAILGVDPGADDATVKSTYRTLVREHHPDRLMADGVPKEFVDKATEKLAGINAAYDSIAKERGLS